VKRLTAAHDRQNHALFFKICRRAVRIRIGVSLRQRDVHERPRFAAVVCDIHVGILSLSRNKCDEAQCIRHHAAVKERLVLHAVAKAEGLGCTEEEVKAFADLRATEGSIFESGTDYLAFYGTETVTEQLLKEKVLSLMKEAGIPTR